MRLEPPHPPGAYPTLVLSERNLLAFLTKLYTKDSAVMIAGGDDCPMNVSGEHDDVHYKERSTAGPMHPVTEELIKRLRAVTRNSSLSDD